MLDATRVTSDDLLRRFWRMPDFADVLREFRFEVLRFILLMQGD